MDYNRGLLSSEVGIRKDGNHEKERVIVVMIMAILLMVTSVTAFAETYEWGLKKSFTKNVHAWATYYYDIGSLAPYDDVRGRATISTTDDMSGRAYVQVTGTNGRKVSSESTTNKNKKIDSGWAKVPSVDYASQVNYQVRRVVDGKTTSYINTVK